jgi:hypothetical protein
VTSTYTIATFASTSPPTYAHDLAAQALAGARAGKRVALLVWGSREDAAVKRAILDDDSGPRFPDAGDIRIVSSPMALMGCQPFDLVVASGSIPLDADLLKEARGRLVSALKAA